MTILDFAKKYLFTRIGINLNEWATDDPQGLCAGSLLLTAQEMAKFGYLYLNDGLWNSEQVVPEKWVNESTIAQIENRYGYLWWSFNNGYAAICDYENKENNFG